MIHGVYLEQTEHCAPTNEQLPTRTKLIDCQTGSVVQWDNRSNYLALSYVWGNTASEASNNPVQFPQLISDVICFTLGVRIDNLWVDKYCIEQDDSADKSHQISQMDLIYKSATATIIPASCGNESEKIPGVSKPRKQQPFVRLSDGTLLVSTMKPASRIFENTVWETRVWTYQEAMLSNQCFVITEEQVRFLCRSMSASEFLHHPASFSLLKDYQHVINKATSLTPHLLQDERMAHQPENIHETFSTSLMAFTKRKLMYQEDILGAFRGILNCQAFKSFWGVPIPVESWQTFEIGDLAPTSTNLVMTPMLTPRHTNRSKQILRLQML